MVTVYPAKKPWERIPKPPRKTAPEPMQRYRPADARMPGESLAAYRGFLGYLRHGSIRKAADALGKNRTVLERWSKRWRWPVRKACILYRRAATWADLVEYEERHWLEAAADTDELLDRRLRAHLEVGQPRLERKMLDAILRRAGDTDETRPG